MATLWCYLLLVFLVSSASATAERFTNSWAVEVHGGPEVADRIAASHGFLNLGQIGSLKDHYHFLLVTDEEERSKLGQQRTAYVSSSTAVPDKTKALMDEGKETVGYVEQQVAHKMKRKAYIIPDDPMWDRQWSLLNSGQANGPAGLDLNVQPAWMQGITGSGVTVAVVDDGVESDHPDLKDNFRSDVSYDFANNDPHPDEENGDSHGTGCAGEIAMSMNENCGIGVAYGSSIAGIKISFDGSPLTDIIESNALSFKSNVISVYSNSWGPADVGFVVAGMGRLAQMTMENGVKEGRNGKGSIWTWAAGNGGDNFDSCAADGYASSIYTVSVGSADQSGKQAYYDENCASKMAVTYSYNSALFSDQIITTSTYERCRDDFTGTSASAPLLTGAMALVLQANPDLSWRDVQYLIAYTSNSAPLVGGEWTTNGAGLKVSHSFGFGAIDAEAMVTRAKSWISVPEQNNFTMQPTVSSGVASLNNPITIYFDISESDFSNDASQAVRFLEHVVAHINLTIKGYNTGYSEIDVYYYYYQTDNALGKKENDLGNQNVFDFEGEDLYRDLSDANDARRGDIQIELTSPQGTKSVLLPYREHDGVNVEGYLNWPFMSVHHWGEDPVGQWELKILFKSKVGYVEMDNLHFSFLGLPAVPETLSKVPSHCDQACAGGCFNAGPGSCDRCVDLRLASTLECVSSCPNGTTEYEKYCLSEPPVVYKGTGGSGGNGNGGNGNGRNRIVTIVVPVAVSGLLVIIGAIIFAVVIVLIKTRKKQNVLQFIPLDKDDPEEDA